MTLGPVPEESDSSSSSEDEEKAQKKKRKSGGRRRRNKNKGGKDAPKKDEPQPAAGYVPAPLPAREDLLKVYTVGMTAAD
jgi:hypothetical protein